MELLFVYEDKVAQDRDGNYYVGSAFSQSVFDRYLELFDGITLIMRHSPISPDDTEALGRMNKITDPRITVIFLPDTKASIRSFLSLKKRIELKKTVTDNITPDRAVIARLGSGSGTIAIKYCNKLGKPVLAEAVGCPWDSLWNHSIYGKVMAPFAWHSMRRSMKHADYAVYVTEEFLQRRYPTDGKQAAISDVQLQPVSQEVLEKRLEKIETHEGKLRIGTAAAVNVAFKGQRFVIEALARLKAEGRTDFEYRLAGGGDNTALKELAERLGVADQVVFEGSIPHDKMFDWLDDLDVYIQPSLTEGMPRALIEAMSRGLPCFASKTGGMPELLNDTAVFGKKNTTEIARLLGSVTKEQMSAAARENFKRAGDFDRELLAKKRRKFYSEFAEAAKEKYG